MIEHKTDLLFNRQLRIHRSIDQYNGCFQKANEISLPAILPLWSDILGLNKHVLLAELVLQLSLENFFLQLTDETFNEDWLSQYCHDLKQMINQLRQSGAAGSVDGSV